jgi:hypothetical protein
MPAFVLLALVGAIIGSGVFMGKELYDGKPIRIGPLLVATVLGAGLFVGGLFGGVAVFGAGELDGVVALSGALSGLSGGITSVGTHDDGHIVELAQPGSQETPTTPPTTGASATAAPTPATSTVDTSGTNGCLPPPATCEVPWTPSPTPGLAGAVEEMK